MAVHTFSLTHHDSRDEKSHLILFRCYRCYWVTWDGGVKEALGWGCMEWQHVSVKYGKCRTERVPLFFQCPVLNVSIGEALFWFDIATQAEPHMH